MYTLCLIVDFVAAAALAWLANRFGAGPWRRATDAHWTERARLLWPARATAHSNMVRLPLLISLLHFLLVPPGNIHWVATPAAAFLGALVGGYPFDRELFPELGFRAWWHQALVGWSFRGLLFVITMGALVLAIMWLVVRSNFFAAMGYAAERPVFGTAFSSVPRTRDAGATPDPTAP